MRIFLEDLWTFAWVSTAAVIMALAMAALGAGLGLWFIWMFR